MACTLIPAVELHAQPVSQEAPLSLKSSRILRDAIAGSQRDSLPTFVSGERISTRTDLDTVVEGDAVLRRGDMVIRADRL